MTRNAPKITVRIDRIVTDQPSLESAALQAALQKEVQKVMTVQGAAAFGTGGQQGRKETTLPEGNGALHTRIATATIKAVSS